MKRFILSIQFAAVTVACLQVTGIAQQTSQSTGGLQLNTEGSSFGASANTTTSSSTIGLPGSFGGPGVTGVARIEHSNTNIFSAFSSDNANSSGMGGSGSSFGGSSFGSTGTMGGMSGMGGLGGMSMGGIGGRMGGMGMGGMGFGGLGGIGGLGGMRNRGGLGGTGNTKQMRVVVRPDYENLATNRQSSLSDVPVVLSRLPLPERLQGINASVETDVVVLTGQVATESDKRLAERIVRLEPGVHSVRNDLQVVPGSNSSRSGTRSR